MRGAKTARSPLLPRLGRLGWLEVTDRSSTAGDAVAYYIFPRQHGGGAFECMVGGAAQKNYRLIVPAVAFNGQFMS
jgi:hypothetical protein